MDFDTDSIWKDFDSVYEDTKKQICNGVCKHLNIGLYNKTEICEDCGEVITKVVFETCEWNNYTNDDGTSQGNSQRADIYVSDNPYDKGGSIPGINRNSLMMRMHYQQTFSHKQKVFWKTSEKFQEYCSSLNLSNLALSDAKKMWHICMESGKLTRASVREGLISSCLFYACIHNSIPVDRKKIIDGVDGNHKGFLKGEKIFLEIMSSHNVYKNLGKERVDIKENDSFIKYCHILELPFHASTYCNDVYSEKSDRLDSVTPKSSIAGIIFFVVKNKLGLKKPSKSKISQTLDVCIPTINKVVGILES
jgi:transcription initiation factor TFIIIB Brf1 subunit/transcription initiation factor TFIIB